MKDTNESGLKTESVNDSCKALMGLNVDVAVTTAKQTIKHKQLRTGNETEPLIGKDFIPDRLNIEYDSKTRLVTNVYFG